MNRLIKHTTAALFALVLLCIPAVGQTSGPSCPLKFKITLSNSIAASTLNGRLLVFMTTSMEKKEMLEAGFVPGETWVAAQEIEAVRPGQTVVFDPDVKAYPAPLSKAKPGTYQFMALLDTDHEYAYGGPDENSYYSPVIKIENIDPGHADAVELTIEKRAKGRPSPVDTANIKLVEYRSPLLTRFWGRPMFVQAGVVLPPGYSAAKSKTFPTVYLAHGFGGDHTAAWTEGQSMFDQMKRGELPEMVVVFLNGHLPTGDHEFADSVNNGPWGEALTREFIPYLEKKFRLIPHPYARFVTGHSSGGWCSLWLQVTYPDFFGGTWSTSPDPVDLRSFTGIDVTPGSTDNAYITKDGKARNLVRDHDKQLASLEQFARQEEVMGEVGGQFASFEWVWSPKGPDGRPLKLFNRQTGELNPEVQKAWQKYDVRKILADHWTTLGPKLRGKLHLFCGTADTFHLNEAFVMLCDFLKEKHSDAGCELIPDRTHFDLYQPYKTYPKGLMVRIMHEMDARVRASTASRKSAASNRE